MSRHSPGVSYLKRVVEINRIYDMYAKRGIPNREIWRRYIYPVFGISERTLYNMLNASARPEMLEERHRALLPSLFDTLDEKDRYLNR